MAQNQPQQNGLTPDYDPLELRHDGDLQSGDLGRSHLQFDSTTRALTSTCDTAALVQCDDLGNNGSYEDSLHCHRPSEEGDTMARNQLIVVSCLCLFFMIAQIIGEIY